MATVSETSAKFGGSFGRVPWILIDPMTGGLFAGGGGGGGGGGIVGEPPHAASTANPNMVPANQTLEGHRENVLIVTGALSMPRGRRR
jgi:hypothetical protein